LRRRSAALFGRRAPRLLRILFDLEHKLTACLTAVTLIDVTVGTITELPE